MPKTLSYADAVRILGQGPESDVVRRLNDLTGGILLGATITTPAVLGWFDAHAVFAGLSRQLARTVGQRLTGAHRLHRTDRIAAAHTIVVIAAYFEVLGEADLPFDLVSARLTSADQVRLVGGERDSEGLAQSALRAAVRLPEPHGFRPSYLDELEHTYSFISGTVSVFLSGLAVWDGLGETAEARARAELAALSSRARERYEQLFLDLKVDCPEVDLWMRERETGVIVSSVREMHDLMARVAPAVTAERIPGLLERAYAALLDRRIVEAGDLSAALEVPTLRQAYVPPLFQVTEAVPETPAGDERVWAGLPLRADLHPFLAGFLTSARAQQAPIVVLGQPGAGKSVLTKVLAAELPGGGFLPIRVPLREVDTSLDLQRQIEQAVQAATTEPVTWPRLAESAGGRLPVILLDGFDELLQATGTSQSDYLYRVADFQQRERDLGRAVAFVVTTRSSVADRAAPPPDTLLLRLAPFDPARIAGWLAAWHQINEASLRERGLRPLPAEVALRFPDLAGQPLLLLLLALYDADENALQHTAVLSESELYERLLTGFARREVRKSGPHLTEPQSRAATDQELRRLSIAAFAMLNRSAQWVTERDLEADLTAVFGAPAGGTDDGINPAALLLGRFFFVHQAQALRGRQTLQTYEFLHATFAEYLVARYTWELLAEAVARASVTASPTWNTDDGLLPRLLSFAALAERGPIVSFLAEMAAGLPAADRERWTVTVAGLFRRGQHMSWGGAAGDYRPVTLRMPARYAAYGANLVLLAVIVSGGVSFSALAEESGDDPGYQWRDQTLLWHSQLTTEGFDRMVQTLAVDFVRDASGTRDVRLTLDSGTAPLAPADPYWLFSLPPGKPRQLIDAAFTPDEVRRRLRFTGGVIDTMALSALTPLLDSPLGSTLSVYPYTPGPDQFSAAQALVEAWTAPMREFYEDAYQAGVSTVVYSSPHWDVHTTLEYIRQLMRAVEVDDRLPAALVDSLVESLHQASDDASVAAAGAAVLRRTSGDTAATFRLANHVVAFAESSLRLDDDAVYRAFCTALAAAGYATRLTGTEWAAEMLGEARDRVRALERELPALSDRLEDAVGSGEEYRSAIVALRRATLLARELRAVIGYASSKMD